MKETIRGTFLNLVSTTYHAEYSWEETIESTIKTGKSFRVTRIPFWKSLTIQIDIDIINLEKTGKRDIFLEGVKRV